MQIFHLGQNRFKIYWQVCLENSSTKINHIPASILHFSRYTSIKMVQSTKNPTSWLSSPFKQTLFGQTTHSSMGNWSGYDRTDFTINTWSLSNSFASFPSGSSSLSFRLSFVPHGFGFVHDSSLISYVVCSPVYGVFMREICHRADKKFYLEQEWMHI